jgi:hypothetical protein
VPYFVYKVHPSRQYEEIDSFENYRDARTLARGLRAEQRSRDVYTVRLMHAASAPQAERLLGERREAPPLGEEG